MNNRFIDIAVEMYERGVNQSVIEAILLIYCDKWHDSDGSDEVHDYLGITSEEYFQWVGLKITAKGLAEKYAGKT